MKERIIAAFLELSQKKGFFRVTMDELSAEVGISKRTLYRYFRSKDEIIEATLDKFMADVAARIEQIIGAQGTPEEIFAQILNTFYHVGRNLINPPIMDDLRQHYPHYWKKIDDFRMKKAQGLVKAFLDDKHKAFTREIDPRIVTTAVLASIQAVANPEFILSNGLTFEDTIRQLIEFFKHGFLKA